MRIQEKFSHFSACLFYIRVPANVNVRHITISDDNKRYEMVI